MQRYYTVTTDSGDDFYSRTSCEVQRQNYKNLCGIIHFYSRTSCEVQLRTSNDYVSYYYFYSRTSCEVQLHTSSTPTNRVYNFYSRTSCEVQQGGNIHNILLVVISTHAPLARCNNIKNRHLSLPNISTHAPLARCNDTLLRLCIPHLTFLLTHLLRGATACFIQCQSVCIYFYSRTSCEVQQKTYLLQYQCLLISTHAPLARCNKGSWQVKILKKISTHAPLARCNHSTALLYRSTCISTHAPLARCNQYRSNG